MTLSKMTEARYMVRFTDEVGNYYYNRKANRYGQTTYYIVENDMYATHYERAAQARYGMFASTIIDKPEHDFVKAEIIEVVVDVEYDADGFTCTNHPDTMENAIVVKSFDCGLYRSCGRYYVERH